MDTSLRIQNELFEAPEAAACGLSELVFIDSQPLLVTYIEYPPSDIKGYFSDGIEYYCCHNLYCPSLWAVQWNPTPQRKLVYEGLDLETYRLAAIWRICDRCKAAMEEEDAKRKRLGQSSRHTWAGRNLPVPRTRPLGLGAPLGDAAPQTTVTQSDDEEHAEQNGTKVKAAEYKSRHRSRHGTRKTDSNAIDAFKDVRLTPPPEVKEDPAVLAASDPSWDVIDDDDANEDWAVINHFGSVAIQHRDAHVDTPTVRP